jgi:hypothetical protein
MRWCAGALVLDRCFAGVLPAEQPQPTARVNIGVAHRAQPVVEQSLKAALRFARNDKA